MVSSSASSSIWVSVLALAMLSVHGNSPFFFSVEDWSIAGCLPNCALCATNYTSCTVCAYRYGQDPTQPGVCKPCSDPACVECTADHTRCTSCTADYGAQPVGVSNGTCVPCTQDGCQSCNRDAASCDSCSFGFGINPAAGACVPCAHQACTNCTVDNTKCLACNVANCDTCDASGACTTCRMGYGLNPDGLCVPCADSLCFQCGANARVCEACYSFAGLDNATRTCTRCDSTKSCYSCGGDGSCTHCFEGYGLDGFGSCKECDEGFLTCGDGDESSCKPFFAAVNTTDGLDCEACELKAVCTDTRMQNPYSTGMVWERDLSRCADQWEMTTAEALPNATLCGVCGATAPTPLPISTAYFNVTTWAINGLLAQQAVGAALCKGASGTTSGGLAGPLSAVLLLKPLSWCAAGSSKPPSSWARHDVRFHAHVVCAGGNTTMALRAMVNVSSTYDGNVSTTVGGVSAIPLQPSEQ